MGQLLYYLVIKPLSWLPLWLTHRFSSALAWFFYSVTGYRRRVVMNNLNLAFPDKSEEEKKRIARRFYTYFCDMIFESIRLFSMGDRELVRRCRVTNPELLNAYARKGQSVLCMAGHTTNFEMAALGLPLNIESLRVMGVYSPIGSASLDRLIQKNRSRTGLLLISRRDVKSYFENPPYPLTADIFLSDQSPSNAYPTNLHWTTFLSQISGFSAGAERYAVRYKRPVVFLYMRRIKRGYYEVTARHMFDDASTTQPGEVMEKYARILDEELKRNPTAWLWTHRRWKRGVPDSVKEQWPPESGYLPPNYERHLQKNEAAK
ncbi:MAG: lysophospholipid acyltransferase family protein [Bacteroidota bacterium]